MLTSHIKDKPIEDDISPITSTKTISYFTKDKFKSQIERIKKASELAQKKMDYTTAHSEEILYAIAIVEKFLRKKQRICYGGQAINAHLPKSHKIYDPTYSIPDYDFFTPSPASDITMLVTMLQQAGFREVSTREGMHEGTTKVYVDYVPVADITELHPLMFKIMHKRSVVFNGIHYMDANSLRMLMYLELSRPRGEVTRWGKVFERLMIFNEFIPIPRCTINKKRKSLPYEHFSIILQFILDKNRIFAGADLIELYRDSKHKNANEVQLHIAPKNPIIFYSPYSNKDGIELVRIINAATSTKCSIQNITIHKSDLIPYVTIIKHGKQIIACIVEYSACHAYHTVPYHDATLRIASLDTLITLYFSLGLLQSRLFNIGSLECMANKLVEISIKTHTHRGQTVFPAISITCDGHQKTLPSLIREKVERITRKKAIEKRRTIRQRK